MKNTFEQIQHEYPYITFLTSISRLSDGKVFSVNDTVTINDRERIILALDHYNYPLPIDPTEKPLFEYARPHGENTMIVKCCKVKYKEMYRAVVLSGGPAVIYTFQDVETL